MVCPAAGATAPALSETKARRRVAFSASSSRSLVRHPKRRRNIHEEEFFETIREFAALDGAFIVNARGVVESAGVYLDTPPRRAKLPQGLGARHAAAAGITAATKAVALVVSESSGTVNAFHGGKPVLTLEKPS